jgi:hypothetical protein
MEFIQSDFVQSNWVQSAKASELKASTTFRLYEYSNSIQQFDILKDWFSFFSLPNFDSSKLFLSDTDPIALTKIKSSLRDDNLIQSSSAVSKLVQYEALRQRESIVLFRSEITRCLDQSLKSLRTHTSYLKVTNVVLVETGRIFLSGEMMLYQLEVETKVKDELFNLRATYYGCTVMASIAHKGRWNPLTPTLSDTQRAMGVVSYGLMGAQIGATMGPIGSAVGAVIGIVVGIALNFL